MATLHIMTPAGRIGDPLNNTPEGFKKAKGRADSLIAAGMPWVQVERVGEIPQGIVYARDASVRSCCCGG